MENTASEIMGVFLKVGDHPEIMKGIKDTTDYIKKDASDIFGFLKFSRGPF
jgi:hypothetical protein